MSSPSQTSVAEVPKQPIIFKFPGLKVDTRLKVFGQEFHVHSAILRLYSAFFRTFLDSPDKIPAPASALFRYEYVSVVDADGTWGLEVELKCGDQKEVSHTLSDSEKSLQTVSDQRTTKTGTTDHTSTKRSLSRPQQVLDLLAFERLLLAIYRKRFRVTSVGELARVVELANFYCALPAVAQSLDGVLLDSPETVEKIPQHSIATLEIAYKLRHSILFREALIHVVATWVEGSRSLDHNLELASAVTASYNRLQIQSLKVMYNILRTTRESASLAETFKRAIRSLDYDAPNGTAQFFRTIYAEWPDRFLITDAKSSLEDLLSNKLILAKLVPNTKPFQAGAGAYEKKFLCASIEDHELPWDREAVDW
ncbi:hypothetical protein LOCC1_G005648 [Lachnellula occidentalis]|uniref:BTB domain-containing protein n=1 Tax=Lachnellula occidentalis TaxID=215460 RepID=A0A8H8UB82_9HELO|nr:hypothetical protein LOCC1_G005648 [Lachnellula occidentalis]